MTFAQSLALFVSGYSIERYNAGDTMHAPELLGAIVQLLANVLCQVPEDRRQGMFAAFSQALAEQCGIELICDELPEREARH